MHQHIIVDVDLMQKTIAQHERKMREEKVEKRGPQTAVCRSVFPCPNRITTLQSTDGIVPGPNRIAIRGWPLGLAGWLPVVVTGRQSVRAGLKSGASLRGFCPALSYASGVYVK
jgi:hypothetical protein